MFEGLDIYRNLSPSSLGLLLFLLGSVTGSFASVVYHRVQSGQSVVRPRSHCPNCRHTLGVFDLIPIVSFLASRGKCRHCREGIHWRYPLLEAVSGGLAAIATIAAGPAAGMACLAVAPAGAFGLALLQRRRSNAEAGITLVEVLASVAILGIALMPALDTLTVARRAGRAAEVRSVTMGLARARLSLLAGLAADQPATILDAYNGLVETGQDISGDPDHAVYELLTTVRSGELPELRTVTVTVSCSGCFRFGGLPLSPVSVTGTVEGR